MALAVSHTPPLDITPVHANVALADTEQVTLPKKTMVADSERGNATKDGVLSLSQEETRHAVETYFRDIPVMSRIAWCESEYRQTGSNGDVVRGVNRNDVGVMQINEIYHKQNALRMGLDLHDLYDNMKYARYLYEREGTVPWHSSEHCWGESLANR